MKRTLSLISILTLLILVVIFTLQNAESVQIQFLFWSMDLSLAILIFILFFLGVIVGVLTLIPTVFHLKKTQGMIQKSAENISLNSREPI